MRRHRPPTLVSMWMLDVFCCALGCVTLLWLLKTREAGQISDEADQASALVTETRGQLDEAQRISALRLANAEKLAAELDKLNQQLALVREERDRTANNLALMREERDQNAKNLALVEKELAQAKEALALAAKVLDKNAKDLALPGPRPTTWRRRSPGPRPSSPPPTPSWSRSGPSWRT